MEQNAQIVSGLIAAGTAVISDVFDNMKLRPPTLDNSLFSVGPIEPFAGPAFTVAGKSERWTDGKGDRLKLTAIDSMTPGVVAVWAGGDIKGVCCFGDLLSEAMKARGCAGVVVDGGVRDSAYIARMGLPMMVRYKTPSQAIGRWKATAMQQPVRMRGALDDWVVVAPGDFIVADGDGVMAIPAGLVSEVADKAAEWAAKDGSAREDIRRGMKLIDTLDKYGHL